MKLLQKIKRKLTKKPKTHFKQGDKVRAKTGAVGKVVRVFVDKVTNEPRMVMVDWQSNPPDYPILLPSVVKRRGFNPYIQHFTQVKKPKLFKRIIGAFVRYLSRYLEP